MKFTTDSESEVLKLRNPTVSIENIFAQWFSGILSQEVVVFQFLFCNFHPIIRFILLEKIVEDHLIAEIILRAVHQVTFVMYFAQRNVSLNDVEDFRCCPFLRCTDIKTFPGIIIKKKYGHNLCLPG